MLDNRDKFECYVDGDYTRHVINQTYMDGRYESWATEAELYAASSLYKINIKVTQNNQRNKHGICHTYRDTTLSDKDEVRPFHNSMYLLLKNSHFSLLQESYKGRINNRYEHTSDMYSKQEKQYDWFDMQSTASKMYAKNQNLHENYSIRNHTHAVQKTKSLHDKKMKSIHSNQNEQKISNQHSKTDVAVTNISAHPLTDAQISLLSKGLKFIPDKDK